MGGVRSWSASGCGASAGGHTNDCSLYEKTTLQSDLNRYVSVRGAFKYDDPLPHSYSGPLVTWSDQGVTVGDDPTYILAETKIADTAIYDQIGAKESPEDYEVPTVCSRQEKAQGRTPHPLTLKEYADPASSGSVSDASPCYEVPMSRTNQQHPRTKVSPPSVPVGSPYEVPVPRQQKPQPPAKQLTSLNASTAHEATSKPSKPAESPCYSQETTQCAHRRLTLPTASSAKGQEAVPFAREEQRAHAISECL